MNGKAKFPDLLSPLEVANDYARKFLQGQPPRGEKIDRALLGGECGRALGLIAGRVNSGRITAYVSGAAGAMPEVLSPNHALMKDLAAWLGGKRSEVIAGGRGLPTRVNCSWQGKMLIPAGALDRPRDPYCWPWGDYKTPALDLLARAVKEFWVDFDPETDRAPTKPDVVKWLMENGAKTKNQADGIQEIIRHPDEKSLGSEK